ncbi:hypothetical protein [Microbacterium sp.]|uniref:hypothetical protein n=1 Tax=Microbacterium sp. TaxID=51671 RepID=UPI0025FDE089|nr:hypothetical protein [Microbacterium sp.]MBT9607675.1 hypothetical protein [Microbacterium sp.]
MSLCEQPILSMLCEVRDEATAMVATAPIQWIADGVGQTAAWFIQGLWIVFDSTTLVDVTGAETVDVPLLAEVLIRIALRSTSASADQNESAKQHIGNAGLSRFFQDALAVKQ